MYVMDDDVNDYGQLSTNKLSQKQVPQVPGTTIVCTYSFKSLGHRFLAVICTNIAKITGADLYCCVLKN